eukprot:CAMPEP_0168560428 /NCGR_PEP_ID=MMETSP0413-20121227/11055_1 /TAXON_ID=136452 /ORGANISM="Filamoeba nolandi, Strain NC-AS-23-1" /LENGTH=851 /DNA_ID=CAMNT_0008591729 /DNA_START=131 /DNA_END=2682 /DNA_ORIENTATION=-
MMYTNPLHACAASGDIQGVDNLLKKGKCKINDKAGESANYQTALHIAAYEGQFDMVYYLLSKGADVSERDVHGWTPLHCAAVNLHLKTCSLLLTRGADPNAVNLQSTTPLHYIIRGQYSEELIEVFDLMIEKGVNLECKNKYDETPLMQAAAKGLTESVRFLLDHHANVNSQNTFKQTPLHKAVECGSVDTVLLLLKNGADPNIQAENGTPLDIAIREKKDEIADILQDTNFSNDSTYTAFQSAKSQGADTPFIRDDSRRFQDVKVYDEEMASSKHMLPTLQSIESSSKSNNENNISPQLTEDLDESWFFGDVSRTESESLMLSVEPSKGNLFLIRVSSQQGRYALSQKMITKSHECMFFHVLINRTENGFKMEDCSDLNVYSSISNLIKNSPECYGFHPLGKFIKNPKASISHGNNNKQAPSTHQVFHEVVPARNGTMRQSYRKSKHQISLDELAKLDASELSRVIINPFPGIKIEDTNPNIQVPSNSSYKSPSLNIKPYNYKNWFYHSDHINFIGMMNRKSSTERFEPLVVSVLPEPDASRYRVIVWSRLGDKEVYVPYDKNNNKHKWKSGLPASVVAAVKQKILESRPKDKDVNILLDYFKDSSLIREKLLEFEAYDPLRPKVFSVGVLFAKEGQTNESDNFANEHGSPAFDEFLDFLGDKIPLQGWLGYRGDLDVKENSTGEYSVFRRWKGYEIMFHVSTLLPYTPGAEQQLHRKRRIGNDLGVIVFQEGGTYSPPIRSQFLHCYYVVSPLQSIKVDSREIDTHYKFSVAALEGVPQFGPELPEPSVFKKGHQFKDFFFTKVINGLIGALNAPDVREKIWCKPKEAFLVELVRALSKNKHVLQSLKP